MSFKLIIQIFGVSILILIFVCIGFKINDGDSVYNKLEKAKYSAVIENFTKEEIKNQEKMITISDLSNIDWELNISKIISKLGRPMKLVRENEDRSVVTPINYYYALEDGSYMKIGSIYENKLVSFWYGEFHRTYKNNIPTFSKTFSLKDFYGVEKGDSSDVLRNAAESIITYENNPGISYFEYKVGDDGSIELYFDKDGFLQEAYIIESGERRKTI